MHEHTYLNTEQAAAYLNIGERKLYDLVASGAVPCSKVTGKWLFPRGALDRWIAAGLTHLAGFSAEAPPPIIGGSHDLLLDWAARRSRSGLALLSEGSEVGLDRLGRNEVAMAAIHLHDAGDEETGDLDANARAVASAQGLHDAVVIAFARREQGLLLAPGNPLGIDDLESAIAAKARFGLRQKGAGAQLLLLGLLARFGIAPEALSAATAIQPYPAGQDLALGIRAGEIDCGIATRSVAAMHGLGFVPLVWERFDLALRRRCYFEPGPQALFALMRKPEFARQALALGGYDVSEAGNVRLNR
jgi:putative molybdopterin biosynthesis protein